QQVPTKPDRLARLHGPWEGIEQAQPSIFESGEIASGNSSRQKLALDGLEPRLGRSRLASAKLLQPLPPPGKPDRPKHRLRRAADDVTHRRIDSEQCRKRRAIPRRRISEGQPLVG